MQNPDAKCTVRRNGDLRNNRVILECFGHRAAYMVMRSIHLRDIEHRSWNSLLVEFHRMSVGTSYSEFELILAHCQFILVKNFLSAIERDHDLHERHAIKHVVEQLFRL